MDKHECQKLDKKLERELRRAAIRAFRKVMNSVEKEPSVVIVSAESGCEGNCPIDEVTAWLFRRRQNNGSARD